MRAEAPCAAAPGERGLQAVLAGCGRARAPAAAAARAGGTLQAVTLDAGRIEAGEGLEAVGREGAGAAAEAGRRARAVGCGARLGVVAGGGRIRVRGRHSAHRRRGPRCSPTARAAPGPGRHRGRSAPHPRRKRGALPQPRPARPGPHALRSGGATAAAGHGPGARAGTGPGPRIAGECGAAPDEGAALAERGDSSGRERSGPGSARRALRAQLPSLRAQSGAAAIHRGHCLPVAEDTACHHPGRCPAPSGCGTAALRGSAERGRDRMRGSV